MSDCRFGVSPVNYPDPDPEFYSENEENEVLRVLIYSRLQNKAVT